MIDYIYEHDQYLIRCRNLDIDRYLLLTIHYELVTIITLLNLLRNLREMLDEAHHATLLNARAAETFAPLLQHPAQKIVVFSWDSTSLSTCRSSNQNLQKRTYSTKINSNAFHRYLSIIQDLTCYLLV